MVAPHDPLVHHELGLLAYKVGDYSAAVTSLRQCVVLTEGMMATTVNGAQVTFTLEGGAKVNGAVISAADIKASNGVIHVIDSVILPPM